jgi:hypothetical protein
MEIFFRKHLEEFLIGFTIVLLGAMVFSFVWGMVYLSESMDSMFEPSSATATTAGFNLSGAQNLNLRGLAPH